MTNTVKEFINKMHGLSLTKYIESRSCWTKFSDWFGGLFYQGSYVCYIDLSETLFNRLKKEEAIKATGTVIDVGGFTVRSSSETKFKITTLEFIRSYDPKAYGLAELVD